MHNKPVYEVIVAHLKIMPNAFINIFIVLHRYDMMIHRYDEMMP